MQQTTIEYTVTSLCDGLTEPPPFSTDLNSPLYKAPDSENIYAFTVLRLGFLEVGFLGGWASGDRLITGLSIRAGLATASAAIYLSDRVTFRRIVEISPLMNQFGEAAYYRKAIHIPQGTRITILGLQLGGRPGPLIPATITIRYNVIVPAVDNQFADAERAHRQHPVA